jgi:hypothetical protein
MENIKFWLIGILVCGLLVGGLSISNYRDLRDSGSTKAAELKRAETAAQADIKKAEDIALAQARANKKVAAETK